MTPLSGAGAMLNAQDVRLASSRSRRAVQDRFVQTGPHVGSGPGKEPATPMSGGDLETGAVVGCRSQYEAVGPLGGHCSSSRPCAITTVSLVIESPLGHHH